MWAGHFAAALALRPAAPRASMLGLAVGTGVLDIVFAAGVALGVEGGGLRHFDTPWSHSLLMAIVWSALYAALFRHSGPPVMVAMAAAVFSHFVLDVAVHNPDMQLYPYSGVAWGAGNALGGQGGWLEGATVLAGAALYAHWARQQPQARRWRVAALAVVALYGVEVVALA